MVGAPKATITNLNQRTSEKSEIAVLKLPREFSDDAHYPVFPQIFQISPSVGVQT